MHLRYLVFALLTSLVGSAAAAHAAPPHCGADLRQHYSARALRRMRVLLQMRLLEERGKRAALAQSVITHRAPVDALLREAGDASALSTGLKDPRLKHLSLRDATTCW
jgi:hypothetical protein